MVLVNTLKSYSPDLSKSLEKIKDSCEKIWSNPLLPWFTNHDVNHSEEIIHLLGQILKPIEDGNDKLTVHELFILLASAYLHDIGMQYLKVGDIPIENLTQTEFDKVRKVHAEKSYEIILKIAQPTSDRDDFHLPPIDEEYLPIIAKVSKGHATDYFKEIIKNFSELPPHAKNDEIRGQLLTSLLMIADELDMQGKRINFSKLSSFNLSTYSQIHWYKHHYVEFIKVKNGTIHLVLTFPKGADTYPKLFKEWIELKLKKQIIKANPIFKKYTSGKLHIDEKILTEIRFDETNVKRNFPQPAQKKLEKVLKKEGIGILKAAGSSAGPGSNLNFQKPNSDGNAKPQKKLDIPHMPPGIRPGEAPPFFKLGEFIFQELCRDLLNTEPAIATCAIYGLRGQAQDGIDLLAHCQNSDGLELGQCKCYKKFSIGDIKKASDDFFKHWDRWAKENVKRFILFVACELSRRQQQDEIIKQKKRFLDNGINYEVWPASEIRYKLRQYPGIVSTYCVPAALWVQVICGKTINEDNNSQIEKLHFTSISKGQRAQEISEFVSTYSARLVENTRHYSITGIDVPLPISKCWIPLEAIEVPAKALPPQSAQEALDLYFKAAQKNVGREKTYDAEWMGASLPRVVLLGGPGAGKSLLLQRIAHREAKGGRIVLLANLLIVAQGVYKDGKSFEESLLNVAIDDSDFGAAKRQTIMQNADLLLLDGLDECGGRRNVIAKALAKWALAHPDITIIITSRIVGHSAAILPTWPRFRLRAQDYLRNLYEFAIEGVCSVVFKDQIDYVEKVEERLDPIINADGGSRKDKEYRILCSVPLLFGFMVSLAVKGCEIPEEKNKLYKAVIELLERTEVHRNLNIDGCTNTEAYAGLYSFGWLLMENPVRDFHDLLDNAGQIFANEFRKKTLKARRLAERAFCFWEERRLFERLHHGAEEIASFVHLGFCEYAAAHFLNNSDPSNIRKWVLETRSDPRWKEVYLNLGALGISNFLVKLLLDPKVSTAPDAEEVFLAADLCAVSTGIEEELMERLFGRLLPNMTSGLRETISKAAAAALPLARQAPQLIGPIAMSLLLHEDESTRFAALALCLEAGKDYVDLKDLRHRYPKILPHHQHRSPTGGLVIDLDENWHTLKSTVIFHATSMLLDDELTPNLLDDIRKMLKKDLSISLKNNLPSLLRDSGNPELIKIADYSQDKLVKRWSLPKLSMDEDETGFLDLVLHTCRRTHKCTKAGQPPFIHLAKLVYVLRMGEMTWNIWANWRAPRREEEAILAICGAMMAVGVEVEDLAKDVLGIKEKLKGEMYGLFALLPNFPIRDNWKKCKAISDVNPAILASAVDHPCRAIAIAAAEMILVGTGGKATVHALKDILRSGRAFSLFILSQIGNHLWGDSTLDLFLSRLELKTTPGCEHLLAKLPVLSGGKIDERIISIIRKNLCAEIPAVAEKAAELCLEYATADSLVPDLHAALIYWKEHEEAYPKKGGAIPSSPRPILVKALVQRQGLSIEELLELNLDVRYDVGDAAEDALLPMAQNDPKVLSVLLDQLQIGKLSLATFAKITELPPASLKYERRRLLGFLTSENPDLRMIMVQSLYQMALVSESDSLAYIRERLNDKDMDVRDAAKRVLASRNKNEFQK